MFVSRSILLIGLSGLLLLPLLAHGQRDPVARADYLKDQELDGQATEVRRYLLEELRERDMGTSAGQRARTANFFSFVLTVSGITLDDIERLEEKEVDVVHAVTAPSRPLLEQALLADAVVVGDIERVDTTDAPADDHRYSLTVAVKSRLKGTVPADTILIRQKQRMSSGSPDPTPEVGESFLFLASNGMYRYYAWKGGRSPEESVLERRYSIYRRYRLRDGRLLWGGLDRLETQQAMKSVRVLDRWLRSWAEQ